MIIAPTTVFYLVCLALPATPDTSDPFSQAISVLRFSFENDETRPYDGDKDFDGLPDDWSRRKGPGFPAYIDTVVDRNRARHGRSSLRFDVNGGPAILYSPVTREVGRIDPFFAYVFQGYLRTQLLEHDAAVVSISFLNHKRQRIQRFVTRPVTGTHQDWVRVRLGPITPLADARFVVIGCHLLQEGGKDVRGAVWFDDLWLGKLPRLKLVTNFATHFRESGKPIQITAEVSGLDSRETSQLEMDLIDGNGDVMKNDVRPLTVAEGPASGRKGRPPSKPVMEVWELPPQEPGFYRVRAKLNHNGAIIRTEETTFAVMHLVHGNRPGEFGWSIGRVPRAMQSENLVDVSFQSGINWLKYPLWGTIDLKDAEQAADVSSLFERLNRRQITPVGLLGNPPTGLRDQFNREWSGVSEVFAMPPSFWYPSGHKLLPGTPVIKARASPAVTLE